ncbi:MAG: cupin domain-containing protein [Ktedonobacteraceae bacterium]
MQAFEVSQLLAECSQSGNAYLEFLRHPSLSAGIYMLPAGAVDPQEPHTEDEVYYIVKGQGFIQVEDENRPVSAGSVVFVKALAEHHFHSITEDLAILVFFAPAEYTNVLPPVSKS